MHYKNFAEFRKSVKAKWLNSARGLWWGDRLDSRFIALWYLKKFKSKLADKFECHNVDSWVLANSITGGHIKPDNTERISVARTGLPNTAPLTFIARLLSQ